ncbi:MAG: hypothetical protein AMXMBFR53_12830 [Gemmatimonadota bacterium]
MTGLLVALVALVALSGCSDPGGAGPGDGPPPGGDTSAPFPIDRGDDGPSTPGTYKGLPLRLAENGAPSVTPVDGVIGVVCVGMSNGNQECGAYIQAVRGPWAAEVSAQVRVVNCAVGGHAVERWNDPAYDAALWDDCRDRKLAQAGVRPDQVRVLWHKAANQFTTGPGGSALPPYPDPSSDYFAFHRNLAAFAARVGTELPSVQAVYTSSRSYGGFAPNPGRGEPLSYEEGHALNTWLAEHPVVDGVWYGWGPYLWAPSCVSGVTNRSGTCYERGDYVEDGVHPSDAGRAKIALLLHQRLRREAWYRR